MKVILLIIFVWNLIAIIIKRIKWNRDYKFYKEINKAEIFNLGSSHGSCSFDYSKINKKGVNLGIEGQTFYYDYKMLLNYFDKIKENSICLLPVSYFSFSPRKFWIEEDKYIHRRILRFSLIDKEDKLEVFFLRYLPICYRLLKKIKYRNKRRRVIKKSLEERIKGHVKICCDTENINSSIFLEKIINKLKEKNIRIILVTTPFRKKYNDYFSKELLDRKFYNFIYDIKNKYNIEYYDFSHEYKIFDKAEYYRDDYDHLNKEGKEKFMLEISKIL